MTLPKTHPLYGAVETLYKTNRLLTCSTCEDAIRALESAGYRVVGQEPTKPMVAALFNGDLDAILDPNMRPWLHDRLREAIAAAPTITETEKEL